MASSTYDNKWQINGVSFESEDIGDAFGFVYMITNTTTGRRYIGRKYFTSKVKRKRKESNWREYYGSCDELLEDIEKLGKDLFKREIVSLHKTRGQVNYAEVEAQFLNNVLYAKDQDGNRLFYNKNILSRYFICEGHSDKTKKKIAKAGTGKLHTEETKEKMSSAHMGEKNPMYGVHLLGEDSGMYGKHHIEETKQKISSLNMGKKRTPETKKNMSDSAKNRWKIPLLYDIICANCGNSAKMKQPHAKYCSKRCSSQFYNKRGNRDD